MAYTLEGKGGGRLMLLLLNSGKSGDWHGLGFCSGVLWVTRARTEKPLPLLVKKDH